MAHTNASTPYRETSNWLSPYSWIPSLPPKFWLKTSVQTLELAERQILRGIWDKMIHKFVPIDNGTKVISTVILNKESKKTPIVMLHGMGAGVGLWVLNYEALCKKRPVYAIDVLGFGRSSRPCFQSGAEETEQQFIDSIEDWRRSMRLEKFVLLGHSLGGFLAAAYALQYPERIRHLILVDPWGFTDKPKEDNSKVQIPWYVRGVARLVAPFNPLAGLRIMGPWGPSLVQTLRPDLVRKFAHLYTDDTVGQYIYHCNAQTPSGEVAFKNISQSFGWAIRPMVHRIESLASHVPMSMIYGSRSWMDSGMGYQVKYLRHNSYVDIQVVRGAGHHVYADQASVFNNMVNKVCLLVDQQFDMRTHSPIGAYRRLRKASSDHASTSSLRRMRRSSEGVLCHSLPSRRRAQSECPPDGLEGTEFILRQNQSFAGIQHDILHEDEINEIKSDISTIEESDTHSIQENSDKSPVTFHLESNSEIQLTLSDPENGKSSFHMDSSTTEVNNGLFNLEQNISPVTFSLDCSSDENKQSVSDPD